MANDEFVDAAGAAKILGISVGAVHQLARRSTMPSTWVAGRRVWKRSEVTKKLNDPEYQKRSRRPGQLRLAGLELTTEEAIAKMREQAAETAAGMEPKGRKRGGEASS